MSKSAGLVITVVALLVVGVVAVVKNRGTPPPASAPAGNLPRVVDLGADKCQACKDLAPILAQLKDELAGRAQVDFIDVWKNPKAGEEYGIRIIPTQIFFDAQGREIWRHEGFLPKADFLARLTEGGMK